MASSILLYISNVSQAFFFLIYQWIGEGGVGREKSEEAAKAGSSSGPS